MTPEQKERVLTALGMWHSSNDSSLREYQAAELMAALLQELVDAPEPEPVAWQVRNGWASVAIYQRQIDAENYAKDQQKRHDLSGSLASFCIVPLYTAPPSPTPAKAPTDVARDAERYRWLRDPSTDPGLVLDKQVGFMEYDEGTRTGGYPVYEYRSGEELDKAIDAAIEREIFGEFG